MIIRYRDRLGGFAAAEQLNEIEGIPESALAFIHIDANHIHKLDINKLNLNQLRQHPYLNFYQAKEICDVPPTERSDKKSGRAETIKRIFHQPK